MDMTAEARRVKPPRPGPRTVAEFAIRVSDRVPSAAAAVNVSMKGERAELSVPPEISNRRLGLSRGNTAPLSSCRLHENVNRPCSESRAC